MRRIVREATLHPRLQSLLGPHELPTVYSYHPVGKERRGQEWPSRYELYGPGIESRWGRGFSLPSISALGLTPPPVQWEPAVFLGAKRSGRGVDPAPI